MEPANNINAANKTYDKFIGSLKWTVPLIAIITFIVVILISD